MATRTLATTDDVLRLGVTGEREAVAREREAAARREAEAVNDRLRREIEHLRRQIKPESGDRSDLPS